jgi:hypothetical protein
MCHLIKIAYLLVLVKRMKKGKYRRTIRRMRMQLQEIINENYLPGLPDAPRRPPTKNHRPAIWENMLGSVYAQNDQGEIKYFHRDYEDAVAFSGASEPGRDPRLYRMKASYQTGPRKGKLVYWVLRRPQANSSD